MVMLFSDAWTPARYDWLIIRARTWNNYLISFNVLKLICLCLVFYHKNAIQENWYENVVCNMVTILCTVLLITGASAFMLLTTSLWHLTVFRYILRNVSCRNLYIKILIILWGTRIITPLLCYNTICFLQNSHIRQASKFQIECTCPSGKWIVKITCLNVPFTCLKYIKSMQLMWESEIRSRRSDKSCRYSTCPTVIFARLRRSDEWNFEPCHSVLIRAKYEMSIVINISTQLLQWYT